MWEGGYKFFNKQEKVSQLLHVLKGTAPSYVMLDISTEADRKDETPEKCYADQSRMKGWKCD